MACAHMRPSVTHRILLHAKDTAVTSKGGGLPFWGCSPAVHGGWPTATTIQGKAMCDGASRTVEAQERHFQRALRDV